MLLVLSPAKTLDYDSAPVTERYSLPEHLEQAAELINVLRELTPAQVSELMHLSDKLAGLNVARYASWHRDFTPQNAKQALLAFKGDVYTGMQAEDFSSEDFAFAQQHLRILSGLYGLLRPLDLMQPYRLEMGTRLRTPRGDNLYQFWGSRIADYLNQRFEEQGAAEPILVNLASQEYFKAVDRKTLQARVVECVFEDFKSGKYKIISFNAKRARGLMMRFAVEQGVDSVAGLRDFAAEDYRYAADASGPDRLVFRRNREA